eukprot:GHUV01014839.1.p1 GENE.GHUV01014839.1~~GHUV01014839.1.p1  ORF type:complete len:494 (+),score=97.36 GHUV01014839.1:67-1548(+)
MSLRTGPKKALASQARGLLSSTVFATTVLCIVISAVVANRSQAAAKPEKEDPSRIATSVTPVPASSSASAKARTCAAESSTQTALRCAAEMAGQRVASFAWQLQQQVAEQNSANNAAGFFTCPISLYIALGLAMGGAGTSSSTQQEFYHLLHQDKPHMLGLVKPKPATESEVEDLLQSLSQLSTSLLQQDKGGRDGGAEMILANGIWTNKVEVQPEYAAQMLKLFQAVVRQAENADVINQWAAQVTKGLIKQAIPPGMPFDLVLTNAVYFKGLWEYAFKKESTQKKPFKLKGGATAQVDMMSKTFKPAPLNSPLVKYTQNSKYEAVRLPYKGTTISAVVVLPNADSAKHGVAAAAAKLDIGELLNPDQYKAVSQRGLIVELPKFKVKTESVSLKKHLLSMGVKDAFDERSANFKKLSEDPLFISDVLQSVCVIVDEEGTEAAAVTAVVMLRSAAVMAPPDRITYDRPFLFMLLDDSTSTPLFVGTVLDPSKSV